MKTVHIALALAAALLAATHTTAQDRYDLNRDGSVDVGDITTLTQSVLSDQGKGWASPGTTAAGRLRNIVTDTSGTPIAAIAGYNEGRQIDTDANGGITRLEQYTWAAPANFVTNTGSETEERTITLSPEGLITKIEAVTTQNSTGKLLET
ncbi:MAG: hypothetical protein IJ722_02730 [Alloprevotella sp.]|nr:hypothetical protein [Alloprevotella sp.]